MHHGPMWDNSTGNVDLVLFWNVICSKDTTLMRNLLESNLEELNGQMMDNSMESGGLGITQTVGRERKQWDHK